MEMMFFTVLVFSYRLQGFLSFFTHFSLEGEKGKQFAKLRHSGLFTGKSNATLRPNSNSTEIKKTRSALSVDRHTEETLSLCDAKHLGKLLSVLSLSLPN